MIELIPADLIIPTKNTLLNAESEWIESMRKDWTPFTITAVLKSSGSVPRRDYWLDQYKHKVVWKVNKRLCRHAKELIVVHEFGCYYEFEESSIRKSFADKRCPHHVHATLLIPTSMTNRIWNETEQKLNPRLAKDFKSINIVSSVEMEPVRTGEAICWLVYSAKGKDLTHFTRSNK